MFRDSHHFLLERWPAGEAEDVKFRLVYDGILPSEQRAPAAVKQQMRQTFHPQLRTLWAQHPALSDMTRDRTPDRRTVDKIGADYNNWGFNFVPLVRVKNQMACRLGILVLLREPPYQVFTGRPQGDLDNRIKSLLDGLRMPRQRGELADTHPGADEDPFFCLLEDDTLISEFTVTTDRLLAPVRPDQGERDVVAVIDVEITNLDRSAIAAAGEGFGRL